MSINDNQRREKIKQIYIELKNMKDEIDKDNDIKYKKENLKTKIEKFENIKKEVENIKKEKVNKKSKKEERTNSKEIDEKKIEIKKEGKSLAIDFMGEMIVRIIAGGMLVIFTIGFVTLTGHDTKGRKIVKK